jgi:hypothetical protein
MRRSYNRPLEPVPPLHVMARRCRDQADDNDPNTKE